ncbi:MAG: UvrD-helicase domain-containing protein [Gammaproteobacteria bacterium]|nr:UvrD-helicase domain-containing protein [Gammaproteobacteria bacterium]
MRPDDLVTDDQLARDEALDVSRSYIVQAPAGSGKTELLIQRYLKLLSTVEHPEEVLAITFTRKAAAEMQYRVLAALQMAARGERPQPQHLRLTADLATVVLRRDGERDWRLISNPRRMRIQTLDSLHASIARSRPLLAAESAGGISVVVDAELRALHQAAAVATLDWLTEHGAVNDAIREVLVHVDTSTSLYVDYLARMLATRDQWLPFVGSGALTVDESAALRRQLESNVEVAVTCHLEQIATLLRSVDTAELTELADYAARNLIDAGSENDPVARLRGMSELPAASVEELDKWTGIAELLLTRGGTWRRTVTKGQGFPAGEKIRKEQFMTVVGRLAENDGVATMLDGVRSLPPVRYTDEQWQVLLALFRLLPVAVGELQRLFSAEGVVDHIEIALTASTVLGSAQSPGDVALLLDYQVRHLLIDEMQDTSSAQYRMLEALTGGWEPGDGRTLFCVGDPMQSIYRFRNAEVGQFLLARQHGIGDVPLRSLTLRRNFRSGESLVDWFNAVFPSILADRDDPMRGAVAYSTAVSVPQQSNVGQCVVHPLFGSSKQQEAERGCSVIADLLAEHPGDEMVVLVRSRTQLPDLLAALRRERINYRAVEIDRLTDLPEVIEVLALTRAAAHQGDRLAWLAILRAAWIGLDWSDLHALVFDDSRSTIWQLLQDEERLATLSEKGRQALRRATPVLSDLVAPRRATGLRELVEGCWMRLGGPSILNDEYEVENVQRYFDVLEKHEKCGSLADVAELEAVLDLERVSSDIDAQLQVMTMHRAKGLEFDHVVLFGLGRVPGRREARVLSWFDMPAGHGDTRKILSPVGPRSEVDKDPLHRFIELSETAKDSNEQARLLYVACTRAQKTLHLVGHTLVSGDGEMCKPPAARSLLRMLWPALETDFTAALDDTVLRESERQTEPWLQPALRRFSPPLALPEAGPLPWATQQPDVDTAADEVEFYWVGTEARIAGTMVHRWLHLFATGRAAAKRDAIARYRPVTERWLQEAGVAENARTVIHQRVEAALLGVLSDDKGRWVIDSNGYAELALTGVYEGKLESVILDRVVIDADETHWIIDYKTSSHEGGDLPGFLRAEIERYSPQLKKYAHIYAAYASTEARCGLYFPLLQRFVEL